MKTVWKSQHENDGLSKYGPGRDCVGYGEKTPKPKWPNGAKVAINFVINYEEGGEMAVIHGDNESEKLLSEIAGAEAYGMYRSCLWLMDIVTPMVVVVVVVLLIWGRKQPVLKNYYSSSNLAFHTQSPIKLM